MQFIYHFIVILSIRHLELIVLLLQWVALAGFRRLQGALQGHKAGNHWCNGPLDEDGCIADSVTGFMELISTGLDRKSRQNPGGTARSDLRPPPACPRAAQPYLLSAASAQSVLLHGQCGRQISPCPHQRVHSQPRKRQRLRRSRESGGGQRKASEQKRSRRAAAGRKTLIVAGVCAGRGRTCVAVGWVSLIEVLAAQLHQRGQFIY